MSKLDGPRSARDITRQPTEGQAPPAAPAPAHAPPQQPGRQASVPDSPLATARTASVSIAPPVIADGPQPALEDNYSDDGMS